MPECECGAHVTRDFARVYGDNTDTVHACFDCETATDVKRGAGAGRNPQPIVADGSGRIGGRYG